MDIDQYSARNLRQRLNPKATFPDNGPVRENPFPAQNSRLALLNKLWFPELSFRLLERLFVFKGNPRIGRDLHARHTATEAI